MDSVGIAGIPGSKAGERRRRAFGEGKHLLRTARGSGRSFIDLFAGCGGLSLGLARAGWRGILAIEKDAFAFATLRRNLIDSDRPERLLWPDWLPVEPMTVGDFASRHRSRLLDLRGKVTLVAGGPPCQGFSLAGRRHENDPRNRLFEDYLKVVGLVRPDFLLLENVRGIGVGFQARTDASDPGSRRQGRAVSELITDRLADLGYRAFFKLLRAADYGVAQLRPRYFMIAISKSRIGPVAESNPFDLLPEIRKEFLRRRGLPEGRSISVREALSDLETFGRELVECEGEKGFRQIVYGRPVTRYQKMLHEGAGSESPNSLRLANHRPDIVRRNARILTECRRGVQLNKDDRRRYGINKQCVVPLDPDMPSHTLTTLPDDILHYSEPRILTVRESARLQAFPDWFEFLGKYTTGGKMRTKECPRYTQVGNAVPPLVAECVGHLLLCLIGQGSPARSA